MLGTEFRTALDECLTAMERGESLEACLARYPNHALRLRSLLLLGQRLRRAAHAAPTPVAHTAAWRRFRQRAHDLRQARARGPAFPWLRPLAIAASFLLVFLIAGGGAVYAAQDSLPDSPLYRVKLASEQARLWLVFDETNEAELLLDQSQERTEEIQALLQKSKPIPGSTLSALHHRSSSAVRILEGQPQETGLLTRAREQAEAQEELLLALWGDVSSDAHDDYARAVSSLHNAQLRIASNVAATVSPDDLAGGVLTIFGVADPSSQDLWLFGGVEVRVDDRTLGRRDLRPGLTTRVVAARGSNGRLHALSLSTSLTGRPQQDIIVAGSIDEVREGEVRIGDQRIAIAPTTLLRLKLQTGQRVEITVNSVDGRPVASAVKSAPITQQPATHPLLAYEGVIEGEAKTSGQTNEWLISGQPLIITPATEIDAQAGDIAGGSRVRVDATAGNDGRLAAHRVTVLAAKRDPASIYLEGPFQEVVNGTWRIAGLEAAPPPNEKAPAQGSVIRLEATRRGERLQALKAFTLSQPNDDTPIQIQGLISSIEANTWQVGPAEVRTNKDTLIFGQPLEGARALVWGRYDGTGSLAAFYINILDDTPVKLPVDED